MADAAVAIAGVALAIPGVIDLLIKYGEWIRQRAKTFLNAREVWTKLGQWGWSLSNGELNTFLLAARTFYLQEGCDQGLKDSLESQIRKLAADVEATKTFLEEQDPARFHKRGVFAMFGERRAKELNKTLALDKQALAQILYVSDIKARRTPERLSLDKRFVHYQNAPYQQVQGTSNLFTTRGDYQQDVLEGVFKQVTVIIERTAPGDQVAEDTLKEITSFLSYRLLDNDASSKVADVHVKGILPCLGYRMQPAAELIFEMPEGNFNPQTLETIISTDQGIPHHPLDFRFNLARKLAESVLKVHRAGLVHKNIRCNTILLLQPANSSTEGDANTTKGLGDVYLTHWRLLRDVTGPTMQSGGTQWTEDIYRHPNRQGLTVQERYNIGHDIYSLGACLLEIGLWDQLVHKGPTDGQPHVSPLLRSAAEVGNHPNPDAELRTKLSRPTEVKNLLLKVARENLPQKMGLGYSRLVVACLTGLDRPSGFGEDVDLVAMNKVEQGLVLKEMVLSFLTEMSTS